MYTSDTNAVNKRAGKIAFTYLLVSLFCLVLGAIYEYFSHEVYSYFMIYAFAIPLVGGALPFLAMALKQNGRYPGAMSRTLYHAAIATLTVGSIISGALEIYGTTNALVMAYWVVGAVLIVGSVIAGKGSEEIDRNALKQRGYRVGV
ncbi:MAG: hypothetical protein IJ773_05175 [Lachnospiraceae bacterium]|nr:hypothetical protein [Lachnospiraceae bacterium]